MAIEPPPSRYRVIERGRRLEVIDTMAGRRPPTLPPPASRVGAQPQGDPPTPMPEAVEARPTVPAAPSTMIAEAPDFLRNVARTVCSEQRDADGRLLLKTMRWYDMRGPREIALDIDGERQVALAVLVLLALAVAGVILAVVGGLVGLAMIVVGLSILHRGKAPVTLWLNRLARTG